MLWTLRSVGHSLRTCDDIVLMLDAETLHFQPALGLKGHHLALTLRLNCSLLFGGALLYGDGDA